MSGASLVPTLSNHKYYSKQSRRRTRADRKMRVKIWLPSYELEPFQEVAEKKGLTTTSYGSMILSEGLALIYADSLELEKIGSKLQCINTIQSHAIYNTGQEKSIRKRVLNTE